MVVLDVTIVAVALPAIQDDLGFSTEALQWVVTAYVVVFGGLLVLAGRTADRYGRRRQFATGMLVFGAASLGCALAPSAGLLVALRAVQGLGAAMVAPAALALLTATFPEGPERRRAVAAYTGAAAGGGAIGWVLGGVLAETAGWEWIFVVNAPIGVAAALLAVRVLEESGDPSPRPLDVPGALTLTGGAALLVLAVEQKAWPVGVAAAALLALFVLAERRAAHPLVPLDSLLRGPFARATRTAVTVTATTSPAMFLAVLHLQREEDLDALQTGLACAPMSLSVIAGASLGPRVAAWLGATTAQRAGLLVIAAGAALLVARGGAATMVPAFVVMGAGLGVASVASTASGTSAVGEADQGMASGVLNAAAELGTVLGLALLVAVATGAGFGYAFAGAAALAVASAMA